MERRGDDERAPFTAPAGRKRRNERRDDEFQFAEDLANAPDLWELTGGNPNQGLVDLPGTDEVRDYRDFRLPGPDYETATIDVPGFENRLGGERRRAFDGREPRRRLFTGDRRRRS